MSSALVSNDRWWVLVRCRILVGSSGRSVALLMSGVPVVLDVGEAALSVVKVMCGGVSSDSEWDFVEPQSFSFSNKRNFACVEEQEDMNDEGTLLKTLLDFF